MPSRSLAFLWDTAAVQKHIEYTTQSLALSLHSIFKEKKATNQVEDFADPESEVEPAEFIILFTGRDHEILSTSGEQGIIEETNDHSSESEYDDAN